MTPPYLSRRSSMSVVLGGLTGTVNLNVISETCPSNEPYKTPALASSLAAPSHVSSPPPPPTMLSQYIETLTELESYRNGRPVLVDGKTLSVAGVVAAARYGAGIDLDSSPTVRETIGKSRAVVDDKMDAGLSVYGVSTGFGGSADTRTDQHLQLGSALLQHQHAGVLPSSQSPLDVLPLSDPSSSVMPESWVKGAILVRMNSLIRGHSGVRFELIEKMRELLNADVTPVVPLRGSISASGDLSPLSYIAGTLTGNPSIRAFDGPRTFEKRKMVSSRDALAAHNIEPLSLASKEHLGILNGTAFSASVATLALNDALFFTVLAQVCTAMGVEALAGTRGSFDPFIHAVARPHPGQVESAKLIWDLLEGSTFAETREREKKIVEDDGVLRQDRYSLRTAPQFMGPHVEDLQRSMQTITLECNSTTDNPLFDGETGNAHHGGNFQAMACANVMEKTRLGLYHLGKLIFSQSAELVTPSMNRGLPPSLAATDPSLNYHGKGIDIASAAYVSELGFLANPVSTHIQINNCLIRFLPTVAISELLSIALDLRAMQKEFLEGLNAIVRQEVTLSFGALVPAPEISEQVEKAMQECFQSTSTMDAAERMQKVAAASTVPLVDTLSAHPTALFSIPQFRHQVAERATELLSKLRAEYLTGGRGPAPASKYLNRTRPVYEFVRLTLGIRMHGAENLGGFAHGLGVDDCTIGQNISLIHEAIRDGKMQSTIAKLFS
ncbi:phenylalanine ammonia-lyase [Fistulina hepatica ATCC 64428]|uniref:Phenylalanine ammonia-lyase n=1 Tax=Fistulina hepatica ATCC 64428 TaxID=1128425 RepID=A0A0D7AFW1_9AGAR|nr:phenylalanine ammonia-lyase [Fistulina hepatica ATCC 64428]